VLGKLVENWPARTKWTMQQLVHDYGDVTFRISQRSPQKIIMKLKDYVSYMELQHDEDPLYIFDDKVIITSFHLLQNLCKGKET
jgi:hypothetical protein